MKLSGFFSRFSIVDYLLLGLLICGIFGAILRFGFFQSAQKEPLSVFELYAVVEKAEPELADALQPGDFLKTDAGRIFGKVRKITRKPHEAVFFENGKAYPIVYPANAPEDVFFSISVSGRKKDDLLFGEDGGAVLIGETYRLFTQYAVLDLRIIAY